MRSKRLVGKAIDWLAGQEQRQYSLENTDTVITNVHRRMLCYGRACPVHRRTDHHMRSWPQYWRGDRGIIERVCEHGIGHPDPDQYDYWFTSGQESQSVHGCDGCCGRTWRTGRPGKTGKSGNALCRHPHTLFSKITISIML